MAIDAGRIVQVIEGSRSDVDRLLGRLRTDRRHTNLSILSDRPVATRLFDAPMAHCHFETWSTALDLLALAEGRVPVDRAEDLLAQCARGDDAPDTARTGTDG